MWLGNFQYNNFQYKKTTSKFESCFLTFESKTVKFTRKIEFSICWFFVIDTLFQYHQISQAGFVFCYNFFFDFQSKAILKVYIILLRICFFCCSFLYFQIILVLTKVFVWSSPLYVRLLPAIFGKWEFLGDYTV